MNDVTLQELDALWNENLQKYIQINGGDNTDFANLKKAIDDLFKDDTERNLLEDEDVEFIIKKLRQLDGFICFPVDDFNLEEELKDKWEQFKAIISKLGQFYGLLGPNEAI